MFNREISGLHQAAYLLGSFALLSQVLALFRDRLLASIFGAGINLDVYYAAFRIPDILFATVASLVSVSVIIPFLIERLDKSNDEAKHFLNNVFSFYMVMMSVVSVVLFFATPKLITLFFPTISAGMHYNDLVWMTRVLLLSPFLLGLSNLFASVTQVYKRFFIYAIAPVMYNVGIMFGIVVLYPIYGLIGLTFGVVLGALLHLLIQFPSVISSGLFPRFHFPIDFVSLKKIIFISLPRTITVSSNEITELFLISFASFLIPGSISVFNLSFNLQSVPFSIIGVSYSLAAFPTLTRLFSKGENGQFLEQMIESSRHIIFWSIPISVLFVVLRAQIVRTVLGVGNFNWEDTRLTAAALALFTVSLVAQNLTTLFVRSYYARGKTKPPLYMNVFSASLIVVLSYFLVYLFKNTNLFKDFIEVMLKVENITGTVVLMLPLGYTIGTLVNMFIHWYAFESEYKTYSRPVLKTLFQTMGSSLIMGYTSYFSLGIFASVFNTNTVLGVFMQGFVSGIIGICIGLIVLILLKSRELADVWSTLHKRIWKTKVLAPDTNI
ncbi:MAG: murein biosynthesis integral membrane protein MurJ [Minisyncoccota bacterium]